MDTDRKNIRRLKVIDPVEKQPERGFEQADEVSPMGPPESPYSAPGIDPIPLETLHPFLRKLSEEHAQLSRDLDVIEEIIQTAQVDGFTGATDKGIMKFLEVLDRDFIPHSREEEVLLFQVLDERLVADGEHSKGGTSVATSVEIMRNDHLEIVQLGAVILNLVRLGSVLPDEKSAGIIINAAVREVINLVEKVRLHMFREDNIVFASANRLVSSTELDVMEANGRAARTAKADRHHHDHGHAHPHEHELEHELEGRPNAAGGAFAE